jgi:hypothetical protein
MSNTEAKPVVTFGIAVKGLVKDKTKRIRATILKMPKP